MDRTYVRGRGSWLWDADGRRVLDFTSQYGAVPLGHNPPELWEAILDIKRNDVPAMVQPSRPMVAEALAERLAWVAPVVGAGREGGEGPVVTFGQSGAEVVEVALTMCRMATGRPLVVAAERGYHGKTLGASALSFRGVEALPEGAKPAGFLHVPFNDARALEEIFERSGDAIAAVVLEPVQGEGGVYEADPAFLRAARELCSKRGAALVLDEIQTGLGRVGPLFGAELSGVEADIVLLSKALGGGLVPLAASIASRPLFVEAFGRRHGSTFANNNLTCSVGLALLDALERDGGALLAAAQERAARLRAGVVEIAARYPGVFKEVRGRGYLIGIELEAVSPESSFLMRKLHALDAFSALCAGHLLSARGVRLIPCLSHGNVLRIEPPLTASDEEIDIAQGAIASLARALYLEDWAHLMRPMIGALATEPSDRRHLRKPVIASRAIEPGEDKARFAFLIHPTCADDMVRTTAAFGALREDELGALAAWVAARPVHAPVCFMPSIRSPAGAVADGFLIALSDTPQSMRARPRAEVVLSIKRAVETARGLGADVIGLGAFTSIATANGADIEDCPAALTTGSALTVAMAIDGVELACARLGRDPSRLGGLVVGLGAVGGAAASILAELLPSVVLAGNPRSKDGAARLAALVDRLYSERAQGIHTHTHTHTKNPAGVSAVLRAALPGIRAQGPRGAALAARILSIAAGGPAGATESGIPHAAEGLSTEIAWAFTAMGQAPPIAIAPDLERALAAADVVIAATSAAAPLISPRALRVGAIVCDVAQPPDVCRKVIAERPDVLVFDGGLARYPEPICFGQNIGHEPGVNLACLTETIVLALSGVRSGRFGVGRGSLTAEVPVIRAAAAKHGFCVADLRLAGKVITEADIFRIERARVALLLQRREGREVA
jgi:acetylornithine/succinyldiaminopimelate/putrescine aminotransferase/predicted amino acid dehydrogenase